MIVEADLECDGTCGVASVKQLRSLGVVSSTFKDLGMMALQTSESPKCKWRAGCTVHKPDGTLNSGQAKLSN